LNTIKISTSLKTFNVKSKNMHNLTYFRINVKMRDGFEVPLVMSYDKTFFNEKSPWIMFTNGAIS